VRALFVPLLLTSAVSWGAEPITFHVLPNHRGDTGLDIFFVAIRSSQEWTALASRHTGGIMDLSAPPPEVNFNNSVLLVANAGLKHAHPVTVEFTSITDVGSKIEVRLVITGPGTCPSLPEEGSVSAMAVIARTDKPIRFDVSNLDRDCLHR